MSTTDSFASGGIAIDDLVALNDEIAALARAGVPLEMGLASWGGDLRGSLGRTANRLAESMSRGASLSDALAADTEKIPPLYRALVTAGIRSGRLPSALESLSRSARNLKEMRSAISLAVLYPLLVALVAYFLFAILIVYVLPQVLLLYDGAPPRFWLAAEGLSRFFQGELDLPGVGLSLPLVLIPPAVVAAAVALWWLRTRRAILLDAGAASRWLGWIPVAGRAARDARAATLAEVMALLVEHDVPLGEALVLAAGCTADRRLARAADRLAAALERAAPIGELSHELAEFPPLVAWLVCAGTAQQTFTSIARHAADTYRRRALRDVQWLRDFLPIWLLLAIGATVATVYCCTLFIPFSQLMQALSGPTGESLRIRP